MTSRKLTASRKGHKVVPVSTIATSEETSPLKKTLRKHLKHTNTALSWKKETEDIIFKKYVKYISNVTKAINTSITTVTMALSQNLHIINGKEKRNFKDEENVSEETQKDDDTGNINIDVFSRIIKSFIIQNNAKFSYI